MQLRDILVCIFEEYDAPIEINALTDMVKLRYPSNIIRRKDIKEELAENSDFILVDAYTESYARIWALRYWEPQKKSLYSYKDWDKYEPRVGKVIFEMVELIKKNGPMSLPHIRDCLMSYRHHISILENIVKHDPLFDIDSEDNVCISIHPKEFRKSSVILQPTSIEDCIFIAQKFTKNNTLTLESIAEKIVTHYKGCFSHEQLEIYSTILDINLNELLEIIRSKWGLYKISDVLYITYKITDNMELNNIIKDRNIKQTSIHSYIGVILKRYCGDIEKSLNVLPFESTYFRQMILYSSKYTMITKDRYYPSQYLPEQIILLSNYIKSQYIDPRVTLIRTLYNKKKCMTLKQIIQESLGLQIVSQELECLFEFAYNLIECHVYKFHTHNKEYYALSKWTDYINTDLFEKIESWLDEQEYASINHIKEACEFLGFTVDDEQLTKGLELWPFIRKTDIVGETAYINSMNLDDDIQQGFKHEICKILNEAGVAGINFDELFSYMYEFFNRDGYIVDRLTLRKILKAMGEVAIIKPMVYSIDFAPEIGMRLGDVAYRIINEIGEPAAYAELEQEIRNRTGYTGSISNVLLLEPKLSRPSRGYYALKEWELPEYDPEIHKRISNYLYDMIKKAGKPLHKSEIMRALRRNGINLNNVTLQMDLNESERINQIATGVYSLVEWNLEFRDLFRFKLPFKLSIPIRQNLNQYPTKNGLVFEYMITKLCLETGSIMLKKNMLSMFTDPEHFTKVRVLDYKGNEYTGWLDDYYGRWQISGIQRWYKVYKPLYGESIFIEFNFGRENEVVLYTDKQFEEYFDSKIAID